MTRYSASGSHICMSAVLHDIVLTCYRVLTEEHALRHVFRYKNIFKTRSENYKSPRNTFPKILRPPARFRLQRVRDSYFILTWRYLY
ncbi:hypothetical protein E2C01_101738 [Portunus trituberculatus]|uniref:Uncharacterized protein n=1 Tax=Portunus trituberculatus TaxID=210409 RepID=A0A5B7KBF2_PORTR|nr:hypothetical protein [Portunus trituberculatus]